MFVARDILIISKEMFLNYATTTLEEWNSDYSHLRIDASKNALFYSNGEFVKGERAWHSDFESDTVNYLLLKRWDEVQSSEPFVISKEEFLNFRENNNGYVG